MKEFIEKLIGRLEEYRKGYKSGLGELTDELVFRVMCNVISIVNELAEEYKNTNIITDFLQYARDNADNYDTNEGWSLADLIDLSIKYSEETINASTNTSSGWIPCSERLPEERDWYLAVFQEGDSDFVLVPRVADYIGKETVCTTNEGWLIINLEDEIGINAYYKKLKCLAWQPLPAPYKEGVTENE
jgi:hypothetical protein